MIGVFKSVRIKLTNALKGVKRPYDYALAIGECRRVSPQYGQIKRVNIMKRLGNFNTSARQFIDQKDRN